MNVIVALCHFCEAHGPRAIFCTYSGCGTDAETVTPSETCTACGSLGAETVLVSRAEDDATYCSREALASAELTALLKQAAIRILTCEVSWSKEGGCVYFSEGTSCHVLGYSFQLSDSRARGLRRWFSSLVLMRDRLQLLNVMPFYSKHMQYWTDKKAYLKKQENARISAARPTGGGLDALPQVSEMDRRLLALLGQHYGRGDDSQLNPFPSKSATELQKLTAKVFGEEQHVCSQRALRLNTGRNDFGPSRSLQQLTGEENIFHKLHMTYTWMLHAGARAHTETLYTSRDLLSQLDPGALQASIFSSKACTVEESMPLRSAQDLLGKNVFRLVLYCTLSGIEVLIKTDNPTHADLVKTLTKVVPTSATNEHRPHVRSVGSWDKTQVAAGRCIVEESSKKNFQFRWPGTLPAKCPTLMLRIENALSNSKFTDAVLDQHVKSLQLQWLGISHTLKNAMDVDSGAASGAVTTLKRALGVTPRDELLLDYWMRAFCA